ncbi:MAG: Acyl carrier protein [Labilithrix sp.]|nr:Acyl carrier protein [Labilithrix sp.]
MDRSELKSELKRLLVSELNLSGRDPSSIGDDALLFGDGAGDGGLGLDSLDALQIAMLVEEKFGVRVPEGDEARPIFRSVATLAEFVHHAQAQAGTAGGAAKDTAAR